MWDPHNVWVPELWDRGGETFWEQAEIGYINWGPKRKQHILLMPALVVGSNICC